MKNSLLWLLLFSIFLLPSVVTSKIYSQDDSVKTLTLILLGPEVKNDSSKLEGVKQDQLDSLNILLKFDSALTAFNNNEYRKCVNTIYEILPYLYNYDFDVSVRCESYLYLGFSLIGLGDHDLAEESYVKLFNLSLKYSAFEYSASSLLLLGDLANIQGDFHAAKDYFFKSLFYSEKAGSDRMVKTIYENLSDVYRVLGDTIKSNAFFYRALYPGKEDPIWDEENFSFYKKIFSAAIGEKYFCLADSLIKNGKDSATAMELYLLSIPHYSQASMLEEQKIIYKKLLDVYLGEYSTVTSDENFWLHGISLFSIPEQPYYLGRIYDILASIADSLIKSAEYNKWALFNFEKTDSTYFIGLALSKCGAFEKLSGNYQKADSFYYAAIPYLKVEENSFYLKYCYTNIAQLSLQSGDTIRSKEFFLKSFELLPDSNYNFLDLIIVVKLGEILFNEENLVEAEKLYNRYLLICEETEIILIRWDFYSKLADKAYLEGNMLLAEEYYLKAINFLLKNQDTLNLGITYKNLGLIVYRDGRLQLAEEYYQKSSEFLNYCKELELLRMVYRNLGMVYLGLGDLIRAEQYCADALLLYEIALDTTEVGDVFLTMGQVYSQKGQSSTAEEYFLRALPYFAKVDQALGQGNVYLGLGEIALSANNLIKAEKLFSKALNFYEISGDPRSLGEVYTKLGIVAYYNQDLKEAERLFLKALTLYEESNIIISTGQCYFLLGMLAFRQGDAKSAEKSYLMALPFFEQAGNKVGLGNIYFGLGNLSRTNYDYIHAIDYYKTSLNYSNSAGISQNSLLNYLSLSYIYAIENKKSEALLYLDSGMVSLLNLRSSLLREDEKLTFSAKFAPGFEEAIEIALKFDEKILAFKYFETIKSRALIELLSEKNIYKGKDIGADLIKEKQKIDFTISSLKTQLITSSVINRDSVKLIIGKLETDLDSLVFEIRTKNPAYASIVYPKAAELKDIQSILNENEVILQYFLSGEEPYLFLISKGKFDVFPLLSTNEEINYKIGILLDGLKSNKLNLNIPSSQRDVLNNEAIMASEELFKILIKPFEEILTSQSELIVVPDAGLNLLPIEVLCSNNTFLIEKFPIKYFQSATLLQLIRTKFKKEHKSAGFAGFGDPVYDFANYEKGEDERGVELSQKDDNLISDYKADGFYRSELTLTRLKGTGEEIESIGKLFIKSGAPIKLFLRKEANEQNAKLNSLKDYRYLSFACHGLIMPDFQSLALSTEKNNSLSGEDGFFTFEEIVNLDWDAELVVLSACQTGKGEVIKSEGIIGLTRAVLYAGSDATVVSLWNVSDYGTKDLMINFFQNIVQKKKSKSDALRGAKIKLLKDNKEPFIWSPFIMYGE